MDRISLESNHINRGVHVHHSICIWVRIKVGLGLELYLR